MKKWPKDGSPVGLIDLVKDVKEAILFAYDIKRKNENRNVPWHGFDIGEWEKVVSLSPNTRLKRKNLKEQDSEALDQILTVAIQLGIEQGRRVFETCAEYQLMKLQLKLAKE